MSLLNGDVFFPDVKSITLELFGEPIFVTGELVWRILNITAIEVLVLLAICVALCIWKKMPLPLWLAAAGFLVLTLTFGIMDAGIFMYMALKLSLYLWVLGTAVAVWKKHCENKKKAPAQENIQKEE